MAVIESSGGECFRVFQVYLDSRRKKVLHDRCVVEKISQSLTKFNTFLATTAELRHWLMRKYEWKICKDLQIFSQEIIIPSNQTFFLFFFFRGHMSSILFVYSSVYSLYLNYISLLIWFKKESFLLCDEECNDCF